MTRQRRKLFLCDVSPNATTLEGPSEQVQQVEARNSILGDTES